MATNFDKLEIIKFRKVSNLYKLLYNQYVLQIISILIEQKQLSVTQIQEHLKLSQSQTSQYLSKLRKSKIVICKRSANLIYYVLNSSKIDFLSKYATQIINLE